MSDLQKRDGLLLENWYIACQSKNLPAKKPLKSIIYDLPLVLFRDKSGKASCLLDRCPHRHAPLSSGAVDQGNITCPYHGWSFDSCGTLIDIPSERNTCLHAGKRKVKSFPCKEQDGFIWIWLGENKASQHVSPWRFPLDQNWAYYVMETQFQNEVTHLAENFMDVPHTTFVHSGWFRNSTGQEMDIEVKTADGRVHVNYLKQADKIGFIDKLLNPRNRPMTHTDEFIMPNITNVNYRFGSNTGFTIISQCTPVTSLLTKVYTFISYKIFPYFDSLLKPFIHWYTRVVIEQDVKIMKLQGSNFADLDKQQFMAGKADIIHHEIEHLRKLGRSQPQKITEHKSNRTQTLWI